MSTRTLQKFKLDKSGYPLDSGNKPIKAKWRGLYDLFESECAKRSDDLDGDDGLCWHSMAVGWAIAKGLDPEEAWDFSGYIRYWTNLG